MQVCGGCFVASQLAMTGYRTKRNFVWGCFVASQLAMTGYRTKCNFAGGCFVASQLAMTGYRTKCNFAGGCFVVLRTPRNDGALIGDSSARRANKMMVCANLNDGYL